MLLVKLPSENMKTIGVTATNIRWEAEQWMNPWRVLMQKKVLFPTVKVTTNINDDGKI